jgi:hypothetical protein
MSPMSRVLIASVCSLLAGCATDPEPAASCTPDTCEGLGVACGTAPDGCGAQLDCGTCEAEGMDGPCVPRACEGRCGSINDGCGGQVDCGGCDGGYSCESERCVATSCAELGTDPNACGGCGPLPIEPAEQCPCGTAASCNAYGQVRCEPTQITDLPDTNDWDDNWKTANGTISVLASDGTNRNYETTSDHWSVYADDTVWGQMSPQLEFHGPSNVRLKVCMRVSAGPFEMSSPVDCGPGTESGGCCAIKEIGQTDVAFTVRINYGLPSPTDDNAAAMIDVTTYDIAEPTAACAAYSFRYRF